MKVLARHPGFSDGLGSLAIYRSPTGTLELRRLDAEGRPLGSIYLEPRELEPLAALAAAAGVAVRGPERVGWTDPDLLIEYAKDDGSLGWYAAEIARRARGGA
jgi:hypothetical protein